jgi:hypothetical protein
MRCIVAAIFLLAGCVAGQDLDREAAIKKLTSSLLALKDGSLPHASHGERITNDLMALSEKPHRPSQSTVGTLAHGLAGALSGRHLPEPQLSELAREILAVLHSAGVGTATFRRSISRAESGLSSLGVSAPTAKKVAAELEAVGKEVRGPEDLPAKQQR